MELLEKMDNYLAGNLSENDKKSFEKEIKNDKNLENEVSKQLLAREAIKLANLRLNVKAIQENFLSEEYSEAKIPKIGRNWKILNGRIAASIAVFLILFGGFQWFNLSGEKLLSQDGLRYQEPIMRGEVFDKNAIEEAYKDENYKQVISIFSKIERANIKEQFLTAMAFYNLKEYGSSNKLIDLGLKENEVNKLYINELQYYKALNLVGLKKYEEAISLFENIKSDPNHLYQKNITPIFLLKLKALAIKNR